MATWAKIEVDPQDIPNGARGIRFPFVTPDTQRGINVRVEDSNIDSLFYFEAPDFNNQEARLNGDSSSVYSGFVINTDQQYFISLVADFSTLTVDCFIDGSLAMSTTFTDQNAEGQVYRFVLSSGETSEYVYVGNLEVLT